MEDRGRWNEGSRSAGYEKLEVYQLAHSLAITIHRMTFALPKFESHEEGSQIRRSAKSVPSNIVEGFALRKYKNEFVHYLYRAYASSEEAVGHLQMLYESGSLKDEKLFGDLLEGYRKLNGKLFRFIRTVEEKHEEPSYLKKKN